MKSIMQVVAGSLVLFLGGCATQQPLKGPVYERETADTYLKRGTAYSQKGEFDKAISDYSKAVEINPGYAAAYYNRGMAYYHKGENDRAREDIHKAQSLGYPVSPGFLKTLRETSGKQK